MIQKFVLPLVAACSLALPSVSEATSILSPHPETPGRMKAETTTLRAPRSKLFGHNMTPTTYTLPKGSATIGNFALAYGLTDNFTIGTSPWMLNSYNMYSVIARLNGDLPGRFKGSSEENRGWGLQLAYFKTDRFFPDVYQMEAAAGWLTLKQDLAPHYTVNVSANYMYFFDETIPFSLRREPFNDDPGQLTVTTLQEIRLPHGLGILGEFGFLGLNYVYPQVYFGLSMSHQTKYTLVQLGFSQNRTIAGGETLYTQQQSRTPRNSSAPYDSALHPEIHLQAFF